MRTLSYSQLELEIVREIKKWRDDLLKKELSRIDEIDAGDARNLASAIATNLRHGIEVPPDRFEDDQPVWEIITRLNEGWEDKTETDK